MAGQTAQTRDRHVPWFPWIPLVLFCLALLPRALYVHATAHASYFADFFFDGKWYHDRALDVLGGRWISERSHFRAPLYPWFLALLAKLGAPSVGAVRGVQVVVGAINAVLLERAARRYVSPLGSFLAAVLFAGYGTLVFLDGEVLTLTFETTLLFLFLIAAASPGAWGPPLSGLILGISAILRPSVLPLALPAVAYAFLGGRRARPNGGPRWGAALAVVAGLLVPVAPVVLGYRALLHDWIPISSQGGINLYIGNHEGADGSAAVTPGTDDLDMAVSDTYHDSVEEGARRVAEKNLGRALAPSEVSKYWTSRVVAFARSHPGEFALLFLKRAYLAVSDQEADNNLDVPYFLARHAPLLLAMPVRAGLIAALGLTGLVGLAARQGPARFLAACCVCLFGATILFLVHSRLRAPLLLLLLPFAGEALARTAAAAKRREIRAAAAWLIPIVLLAAFTSSGLYVARDPRVLASVHFLLGHVEERAGNDPAAAEEYRLSLGFDPSYKQAHLALGNALARMGRPDEAKREYELLLAQDARYEPFVASGLGSIALDEGDTERAVELFRKALASDPSPTMQANLGVALLESGRALEAVPLLEKAWSGKDVPFEIGVDLARARAAAGDSARGEADLAALLARDPRSLRGWMILADMRGARGDPKGEADALRRALRIDPALPEARARLAAMGESE